MEARRQAYFTFAVLWILVSAWQYGFHISALNSAQDAISCRTGRPDDGSALPSCVQMNDFMFGALTSLYTIGGLFGSLGASHLADRSGRRRAVVWAAVSVGTGSVLMGIAPHYVLLVVGRLVLGVGCGLSTVLVPTYLDEIAPANIRGSIGVLNQIGIVFGILTGQALSLPFAKPSLWRVIFAVPAGMAALQILLAPFMIESPLWNRQQGKAVDSIPGSELEREGLLGGGAPVERDALTLPGLLLQWRRDPAIAKGMRIVFITQVSQQLSGINAVMYYSTAILKSVLATRAAYISLFITIVNVVMTIPPVFLIERLGRRTLLLCSSGGMSLSSLVLAFSINSSLAVLSSVAIVAFVSAFSIGLGPVPFVVLGEALPSHAKSAAGSFGLGVNWLSNFAVGLLFLPIRNALASGGGRGDGNVFFLFFGLSGLATLLMARIVRL